MKKNTATSSFLYWGGLLVAIFFMFGFGYICPTWGPVTRLGVKGIGIFIGAVFMVTVGTWGLIMPALLSMFALYVSGAFSANDLIVNSFGNSIVVQIIFIYALCQSAAETGVGEIIAKWLISRKFSQGKPFLWTMVFFIAAYVIGALLELGGLLFCYTILKSICDELGYEDDSDWNKFMTFGTFLGMLTGCATLPFKGIPLIIFGNFLSLMDTSLSMGMYIAFTLIVSIIFLLLFTLLMKYVFRVDMSKLSKLNIAQMEGYQNLRMSRSQVAVCLVFVLAIAYPIASMFIDNNSAFGNWFNGIGVAIWFILCFGVMGIIRVEGKPIVDLTQCLKNGIQWSCLLQLCAFLLIGNVLGGNDGGIREWLVAILTKLFGDMPLFVFILLLSAISIIITNFLSNIATGVIMAPLCCPFILSYAEMTGCNITVLVACVIFGSNISYLTMSSGAAGALLLPKSCYANDGKFIWRIGGPTALFLIILLAVLTFIFCRAF